MSLLLVQHGKSLPKDKDPEKGLSPEGKNAVERIAALAKEYGVTVSAIHHSGKKRARETADIFADQLKPSGGVKAVEGMAALDDVTRLNPEPAENLMLVGHLPFMEKLTSFLVTKSSERPSVLKFQNGGIVGLDRDPETNSWFIKWTLFPTLD